MDIKASPNRVDVNDCKGRSKRAMALVKVTAPSIIHPRPFSAYRPNENGTSID